MKNNPFLLKVIFFLTMFLDLNALLASSSGEEWAEEKNPKMLSLVQDLPARIGRKRFMASEPEQALPEKSAIKHAKVAETAPEVAEIAHKDLFPLMRLPVDMVSKVISCLPICDLTKSNRVCRRLFHIVWKEGRLSYAKQLHQGIHIASMDAAQKTPIVIFSLDGNKWFAHAQMKVDGDVVTDVQQCRLVKFNDQHYAAILRKSSIASRDVVLPEKSKEEFDLQILSCKNGKTWTILSSMQCEPLLDLQVTTFQGKLWLAYVPAATRKITLTSSSDGAEWTPRVEAPFLKAQKVSLAGFQNQLYMAYAESDSHDEKREESVVPIRIPTKIRLHHRPIFVASSSDGKTWRPQDAVTPGCAMHSSLQLIPYKGNLKLAFTGLKGKTIQFYTSADGREWLASDSYTTLSGLERIDLQIFRDDVWATFFCFGGPYSPFVLRSNNEVSWTSPQRLVASQELLMSPPVFYSRDKLHNFMKYLIEKGHTKTQLAIDLEVPLVVISKIADDNNYKPRKYNLLTVWEAIQARC